MEVMRCSNEECQPIEVNGYSRNRMSDNFFYTKWFPQKSSPECLGEKLTERDTQKCAKIKIRADLVQPASTDRTRNTLRQDLEVDTLRRERRPVACQAGQGLSESTEAWPVSPADICKDIQEIEQFLKDGTMFHDSDMNCENFQDLRLWCPASLPGDTDGIDFTKAVTTADPTNNNSTPTSFSPQVWDQGEDGINSPLGRGSFFSSTPTGVLSPNDVTSPNSDMLINGLDNTFSYTSSVNSNVKEMSLDAEFFDINNLAVDFGLEHPAAVDNIEIAMSNQNEWSNILDNEVHKTKDLQSDTITYTDKEDSLGGEMEVITWSPNIASMEISPVESPFGSINNNETVITEFIINEDNKIKIESDILLPFNTSLLHGKRPKGNLLRLNMPKRILPKDMLNLQPISTPDILNCVVQLESEKFGRLPEMTDGVQNEECIIYTNLTVDDILPGALPQGTTTDIMYDPSPSFKSEPLNESDLEDTYHHTPSLKRRRHSSDSDETYTPYLEKTPPRRNKRRQSKVDENSPVEETKKVKRGRPPKRRESIASTCTTDDNASCASVKETTYRELRDKNNKASKRSRMNRKQKETEMEHLARDLEQRNKKLQVKADILEDMTKRLKDALMSAILQK